MNLVEVLLLAAVCSLLSSAIAFWRGNTDSAILLLVLSALLWRVGLVQQDPFLYDWDEQFHALVARNLVTNLGKPVLRAVPVLPYDYREWWNNHIWVHKQPLFLWQMALSLKMLGATEFALRLPGALLGTAAVGGLYRLGHLALGRLEGFLAAVLGTVSYYQLELTTGWQSVDHADVAFGAYITLSLWAYYESRTPVRYRLSWGVLTGIFAGAAVLCKWLPGLLVYAVWGADVYLHKSERQPGWFGKLLAACVATTLLVVPWQLYIKSAFPQEASFETAYAARHFVEVLEGKGAPWYFYLTGNMWYQYQWLVLVVGTGMLYMLRNKICYLAARPLWFGGVVVFGFFSVAATKMPSYTYIAAPVILLVAAVGWAVALRWLSQHGTRWSIAAATLVSVGIVLVALRPISLVRHHTVDFAKHSDRLLRQQRISRAVAYRQLDKELPQGYVVFNAPTFEDIEAMFYCKHPVYAGLPTEAEYNRVREQGWQMAVFTPLGPLPAYLQNQDVKMLPALAQ